MARCSSGGGGEGQEEGAGEGEADQVDPEFHRHLTVRQYGFWPWLKLIISRKVEGTLAEYHHTTRIKRSVFCAWLEQSQIAPKEKEKEADRFMLKKWLRHWAKVIVPSFDLI